MPMTDNALGKPPWNKQEWETRQNLGELIPFSEKKKNLRL